MEVPDSKVGGVRLRVLVAVADATFWLISGVYSVTQAQSSGGTRKTGAGQKDCDVCFRALSCVIIKEEPEVWFC